MRVWRFRVCFRKVLGFGVCGFAIPRKLLPPAPKIQRGPCRVGFEVSDAGVWFNGVEPLILMRRSM